MDKHLKSLLDMFGFRVFLIVILLIAGALQFFMMLGNVLGDTYDVKAFQLAPETIRAVKTVEDVEKTEKERKEAEEAVEPVYVFDEEIAGHRTALLETIYEIAMDVRKDISAGGKNLSREEQIGKLKEKLKEVTDGQDSLELTDEHLWTLLTADEKELDNAQTKLINFVQDALSKPVRKENVSAVQDGLESKIRSGGGIDEELIPLYVTLGRAAIVETEKLDKEKTEELKQQAREAVEPTRILQGQIIVQEGELIDREKYRQLELLGMTDNKTSIKPVLGLAILVLLQMAFLYFLFDHSKTEVQKKRQQVLATVIIYLFSIGLMEITGLLDDFDVQVAFIYPSALATMLVSLLASRQVASLVTVMVAASAGIVFQEGYSAVMQMEIALYILLGGFSCLYIMNSIKNRSDILKACGIVVAVNVLFIAVYLLMSQSHYDPAELLFYGAAAVVSGTLSGALTMGLLPFFESALGILSTMKLIELSNPNHPLLKKILTETPGTYHHSIMVANLAEAACEAIGADGLLARVGSYYHDIGKTRRPVFFVENQVSGINPHDSLPPERSAEIIIAHTTDGAEILRKHRMPQEIIDIALQHHGTSPLKYFLHKAKEEGKLKDESNFRYPGPKPQTKEIAVISIADSVEAAVRSMKEPTSEKIRSLVHSIIKDRLEDNQFDECDLSIKELKIVEKVLCETLNGTFHSRIEYPKEERKQEQKISRHINSSSG
ncbi:HDIG domain-containing metalloprotein [Ureibacillus sp. FSL K6-8385]|uniref:HDIG domain-containing protein n=1 Tax=Ureibacillus terrenus TaxID=118246 RepID=A0A540V4U8_9BACL|nr:HDIG domain-containing metalloprotein [Ureibacillus terrenus]MED3661526.1 HDIG domain-containing protein [Ureibacillus terrenus]MED3763994.1 HDIG domain-containing protein [Ureibacillus terrenus]TQE91786.1 HDIG domain-containing protein [Ureibacillus terrenus]